MRQDRPSRNRSKLLTALLLPVLLWCTLAIYYSESLDSSARLFVALSFFAFGFWAVFSRHVRARWVLAAAMLAVIVGWVFKPPSNHRPWRPEVAVTPRAVVNGDRVRFSGVRDFVYRSADDFTVRYVDREVDLSKLESVDFFISYWAQPPGMVGHTFVSFNFADAEPLAISIETRPEIGESFDPIGSMFKMFELIYVVGTERDLIGVRANYRGEAVYGYRLRLRRDMARDLFMVYVKRINELADKPEYYHLLSNNCTLNIFRYANRAGREGDFDFRHLLNGWSDRYLYEAGMLSEAMPFGELRRHSRLNEAAGQARNAPFFSSWIRKDMPPP